MSGEKWTLWLVICYTINRSEERPNSRKKQSAPPRPTPRKEPIQMNSIAQKAEVRKSSPKPTWQMNRERGERAKAQAADYKFTHTGGGVYRCVKIATGEA